MEYRYLGRSGLQVSVVGLGCNNFGSRCDFEQSRAVVHKALDDGINLFDTADVYGGAGTLGGVPRPAPQGHTATTSSSPPSSA